MRILLVTSMYPPYGSGGVSSHVEALAAELSRKGHAVTVLSCRRGANVDPDEDDGVDAIWADSYAGMFTRIGAVTRREPFDVVHFHAFNALALAALCRDEAGATVFTLHSDSANYLASVRGWRSRAHPAYRALLLYERLSSGFPDLTIAVSRRMEAYGRALGIRDIVRIPNAVDTAYWTPSAGANGRNGHVLLVPRMHVPKNGIAFAIGAMRRVLEESDATLHITGEGPLRAELERLARQVAPGRIRFLGLLDREALRDAYRGASAVIVPSVTSAETQENTSLAALEAMACGTPVIATDIGGLPEVIAHGDGGLLVPERDARAIADAALALLGDPSFARDMARRARDHVVRGFAASDWADVVLRAYDSAFRGRAASRAGG